MDLNAGFYDSPQHSTAALVPDASAAPAGASASPVAAPAPVVPTTLDEELASVMTSIGSFWGKVRKQSVTVLQTANEQLDKAQKDLTPLVTLARTNLEKFGEQTKAELERLSEASANVDGVMIGADGTPILTAAPRMDKGKGVDRTQDETPTSPNPNSGNPTAAASAFFAKIQAQITSNSNVQELSKNLVTLQSNVTTNLSHIPTSFQTNLSQLQAQLAHIDLGESQKLAEDYVHKGEAWLAEFSTEIGRLAKDAVKVVPPSAEEMDRTKIREARLRQAEQVAVGRKDTMIQRLREDPAVLLVDPAQPPSPSSDGMSTRLDTRESFARFLQSIEDGGGLEGEVFEKRISDELSAAGEGEKSLASSLRATVGTAPSQLTREAFWSRYFFRVGQIEDEEQRRKQVLEVASAEDDSFSWDMEDEDEATPPVFGSTPISPPAPSLLAVASPDTPKAAPRPRTRSSSGDADGESSLAHSSPTKSSPALPSVKTSPTAAKEVKRTAPEGQATSTAPTSPRASSDGMSAYDVVSAASGNPSEAEEMKKEAEDDGEDSDWE